MLLIQFIAGVLLAVLLWNLFKLTFQAMLWALGLTLLAGIIIPGLLMLIGGFTFVCIGLFATLGLLVLLSALMPRR